MWGYFFFDPVVRGIRVHPWISAYVPTGAALSTGFYLELASLGASAAMLLLGLPFLLARARRKWQLPTEPIAAEEPPSFGRTVFCQLLWALVGVFALGLTWTTQGEPLRGIEALWGRATEAQFPGVRLAVVGLLAVLVRSVGTMHFSERTGEWVPTGRWSRAAWHPIAGPLALLLWGFAVGVSWRALLGTLSGFFLFAVAWLGAALTELAHAAVPWATRTFEPDPPHDEGRGPDPFATAIGRAAWDVIRARHPLPPPSSHAWALLGWLLRLLLGVPLVALWGIGHASFSTPFFSIDTWGRWLNLVLAGVLALLLLAHLPLEVWRGLRARAARELEIHRRSPTAT